LRFGVSELSLPSPLLDAQDVKIIKKNIKNMFFIN